MVEKLKFKKKIPIVIYIGNLEQNPGMSLDFQLPEDISPGPDSIFDQNKVLNISLLGEKHNFERLGPQIETVVFFRLNPPSPGISNNRFNYRDSMHDIHLCTL